MEEKTYRLKEFRKKIEGERHESNIKRQQEWSEKKIRKDQIQQKMTNYYRVQTEIEDNKRKSSLDKSLQIDQRNSDLYASRRYNSIDYGEKIQNSLEMA